MNGNMVVPGSETILIDLIPSDAGNHNAGQLRFGSDGKLYASTGDGGSTPANSQSCASCHSADGNSSIAANPKLAQQHPEYILKQLQDFKSGKRKSAIMKPFASALSDEDMRNVAYFVGSKKIKPGFAKDKDTVALGEKIFRGGVAGPGSPDEMRAPGRDLDLEGRLAAELAVDAHRRSFGLARDREAPGKRLEAKGRNRERLLGHDRDPARRGGAAPACTTSRPGPPRA